MADIDGQKELRRAVRELGKTEGLISKVARRAVNRTVSHSRTFASRKIRDQVRLKAGYVNKHLKATKAKGNSLTARLRANERPVLLTRYGARPLTRKAKPPAHKLKGRPEHGISAGRKQAGVSVSVKRGGSRQKMRGSFLITLKGSGATGVAVRTGPNRDDYKVLHGPSVDQLFRRGVRSETRRDGRVFLRKETDRLLGVEMKKLWPKR